MQLNPKQIATLTAMNDVTESNLRALLSQIRKQQPLQTHPTVVLTSMLPVLALPQLLGIGGLADAAQPKANRHLDSHERPHGGKPAAPVI